MKLMLWCLMIICVSGMYAGTVFADDNTPQTTIATTQVQQVFVQTETVETVTETQSSSFGQTVKNGFAATGRGIKKGALWTWNGMCKGAFYMKEGTVSVLEKTGLKAKSADEINAHEVVIREANKTLTESRTRRELREDRLARSK